MFASKTNRPATTFLKGYCSVAGECLLVGFLADLPR